METVTFSHFSLAEHTTDSQSTLIFKYLLAVSVIFCRFSILVSLSSYGTFNQRTFEEGAVRRYFAKQYNGKEQFRHGHSVIDDTKFAVMKSVRCFFGVIKPIHFLIPLSYLTKMDFTGQKPFFYGNFLEDLFHSRLALAAPAVRSSKIIGSLPITFYLCANSFYWDFGFDFIVRYLWSEER